VAEARPGDELAADAVTPETDGPPTSTPPLSTPTTTVRTPLPHPRPWSDHGPDSRSQPADVTPPRLRLTVLGRPAVHLVADDTATELRIRRSDGLQLLVHLTVTPEGATSDQLMAAVWPEVRPRYARGRFHTTISELRHHLGDALGADAITRTGDRHRLDPEHVDVDLWQLTAAVHNATTAIDADQHGAALRQVVAVAGGPIADGYSWLWLAPYREEARRHVLDAHVGLADIARRPTRSPVAPTRRHPRRPLQRRPLPTRHAPVRRDGQQRRHPPDPAGAPAAPQRARTPAICAEPAHRGRAARQARRAHAQSPAQCAYDGGNTGLYVRKGSNGLRVWVFNVSTQSSRLDLEKQLAAIVLAHM
jgi:hypothetical protein